MLDISEVPMNDFLMHGQMQAPSDIDIRMMNPLKLAYLGDAIYEAYIRLYIVSNYTLSQIGRASWRERV